MKQCKNFSDCQDNQETDSEETTEEEYIVWYKCTICKREWYVVYKFHAIFDDCGELIHD